MIKKILLVGIIITTLIVISCSGNNPKDPNGRAAREELANQFSPQEEYYIGRSVAAMVLSNKKLWNKDLYRGPVETFSVLETYINHIGSTLVLASKRPVVYDGYRFIILDSNAINAFAVPGGFIFITSGLIKVAENEDEIAGALAHEAAHVMLKHPLQAIAMTKKMGFYSELGAVLAEGLGKLSGLSPTQYQKMADIMEDALDAVMTPVLNGYNGDMEKEADLEAIDVMVRAGYNPYALVALINKLAAAVGEHGGGYHGSPSKRAEDVEKKIESLGLTIPPIDEKRTERFILNTAALHEIEEKEAEK